MMNLGSRSIDRQHRAGWRDVLSKPLRDRGAARADIEHSHPLGDGTE
jgi:hypothetical protein